MFPVQDGGAVQVWFLQSSRFGQAYVFCILHAIFPWTCQAFGMLHAHLLVHAHTNSWMQHIRLHKAPSFFAGLCACVSLLLLLHN